VLRIVPVGAVTPPVLERAAAVAREVLGFSPLAPSPALDPAPLLDATRRQYRADLLLAALRAAVRPPEKVLGLTALDLCLPVLTYVFGFAELGGAAAVVSVHRLDPRFSGRADDPGLMLERLEKEVLHELGHLFGLTHCGDRRCVMASAHDVGEIDIEEPTFCRDCRAQITRP
jgi:archaemetzincin